SEEHTSELQSPCNLVCRLLLEKKKRGYAAPPAVRENVTKSSRCGSVGGCGAPQRQHAVERELIDRLADAGLLDLARDGTQAERIEGDGSCRAQERQVPELRCQLEITHWQIAFDLLFGNQPGNGCFFIAELIDQLQFDRLTAGEDAAICDLFE